METHKIHSQMTLFFVCLFLNNVVAGVRDHATAVTRTERIMGKERYEISSWLFSPADFSFTDLIVTYDSSLDLICPVLNSRQDKYIVRG